MFPPGSPPRPPGDPNPPPPHILVVDPHLDRGRRLAQQLGAHGYTATATSDGTGALDAVQSAPAQVVLLELDLPGMSIYEVAAQLRGIPGGDAAVLVAVSEREMTSDLTRAHAVGIDAFLSHPIEVGDVDEIVGWIE